MCAPDLQAARRRSSQGVLETSTNDMFFNPDDVRWFKPAEISTKYGLQGVITEPICLLGVAGFNSKGCDDDTLY